MARFWLIVRLAIFVLTISHALTFVRCTAEFMFTNGDSLVLQGASSYLIENNYADMPPLSWLDIKPLIKYQSNGVVDIFELLIGDTNPCIDVWSARYGDHDYAQSLYSVVRRFTFCMMMAAALNIPDQFFFGTRIIYSLLSFVLGHLWAIYFDAPRQALLALLTWYTDSKEELMASSVAA